MMIESYRQLKEQNIQNFRIERIVNLDIIEIPEIIQ
jgi:hypothetical protein